MAVKEKLNVAIEIGSFSFKVAVINRSSAKTSLEFFKVINISSVAPEQKISYIIDFIEKELVSRVLLTSNISINFCDPSLQIKIIELPIIPKNEIRPAIELHLNTKFSIDSSFIFDYEINGQKTDSEGLKKTEIVCAIVRRDNLNQICDALAKKGFVIEAVNISAFSYIAILKELGLGQKEPVAVVDIGYNVTDFIVYSEHKIKFIRKFFIGSQQFSEAIKEKMQVQRQSGFSGDEANILKEKYGIPGEDFVDQEYDLASGQLLSMLRPCLEKFVSELKHSIDYYQENAQISKIKNIFLVGGGTRLRNLDSFLSQKANTQIRAMEIPKALLDSYKEKQELQDSFVIIAGVVGLALAPKNKVNLLPLEFQVKKIEKLVKRYMRIAEIAIAAILLLLLTGIYSKSGQLQKQLKSVNAERGGLEDLRLINSRVSFRNNLEERLKKGAAPVDWYLKEISKIIPDSIVLNSIDLNKKDATLKIDGIVLPSVKDGTSEITNFMNRIEDSPFFESADLSSSNKISKMDRISYSFSIKCKIK